MSDSGGKRVSVALCTYNGEAFLGDQLRSILNQDAPALEVVISDDGSTDGTLAVIEDVTEHYSGPTEIRLIHTTRVGGVTQNFDRAIGQCRGEIVALSDQDDTWEPHKLRVLGEYFVDASTPHLVFSDAALIDDAGARLSGSLHGSLRLGRRERHELRSGRAFELLIRRNVVTGAVAAFSRDLYTLATPFPTSWVHDEWLAILASAIGDVALVNETLVNYRLHAANQIGVADPGVTSRIGRMLEPRGDRYSRLEERSRDLVLGLERLAVPDPLLALARRKLAFEEIRAAYPKTRLGRIGPIAKQCFHGSYARLSSQRRLDTIRDLLQSA
ncbi:MAG: glycosyltransferase family 2 protein [Demequinaceae bacterium]|nr:glycosyltransferase family 2 protein [Demequinaceae bacterium]